METPAADATVTCDCLTEPAREALRDLTELMREAGVGELSWSDVVLVVSELAHRTSNEELQECAQEAKVITPAVPI